MHLRLPLVLGVFAVAAAAAFVRVHASPHVPSLVTSRATSPPLPSASAPSSARLERPGDRTRASSSSPPPTIVVYVAGAVVRPGIYTLARHSRAADAVRAAGGAQADADLVALNLAAPVFDGDEVAVRLKGAEAPPGQRRAGHRREPKVAALGTARPHRRTKHARRKPRPSVEATETDLANEPPIDIVDLNRADAMELETLPGIGSALAERIVTVREATGPFASADDLLDIGGMTQGRLEALLPYIVVR